MKWNLVAIPSLFQGISSLFVKYHIACREKSQSLHFFRAFQEKDLSLLMPYPMMGVAIPSLFQGISSSQDRPKESSGKTQSQSLHFFRAFQGFLTDKLTESLRDLVAIPSLFQGISSPFKICKSWVYCCRNPFTFSGHFKSKKGKDWRGRGSCRNPFTFSGHFKEN